MQPSPDKLRGINVNKIVAPIVIKGEGLARRCEICHQEDLYDPINNSCGRCKDIEKVLIRANRAVRLNTNTTAATNSFNDNGSTSTITFSIVVDNNLAHYIQPPLVVALNPIQAFLGKVDRAVEAKIAKISNTKKMVLAVVLCLIGLSGAISTLFGSVKSSFVRANNPNLSSASSPSSASSASSVSSPDSFHSTINSMINNATKTSNPNDPNGANNPSDSSSIINTDVDKSKWQPIETLLASTPTRRDKAFNQLGLSKRNSYVIAAFSLGCEDCINLAKELNEKLKQPNYQSQHKLMGVANASEQQIDAWKQEHNIDFLVKPISENTMDDLGVALFPTLINVVNGKVKGVSEYSDVLVEGGK